jgi:hypothetical protein
MPKSVTLVWLPEKTGGWTDSTGSLPQGIWLELRVSGNSSVRPRRPFLAPSLGDLAQGPLHTDEILWSGDSTCPTFKCSVRVCHWWPGVVHIHNCYCTELWKAELDLENSALRLLCGHLGTHCNLGFLLLPWSWIRALRGSGRHYATMNWKLQTPSPPSFTVHITSKDLSIYRNSLRPPVHAASARVQWLPWVDFQAGRRRGGQGHAGGGYQVSLVEQERKLSVWMSHSPN